MDQLKTLKTHNAVSHIQKIGSLINDLLNEGETPIDINPLYQRDVIWNDEKSSGFINSVFRGISTTNITFAINDGKQICIDGKQRCNSLLRFKNNNIPVIIDGIKYFYGPDENNISSELKKIHKGFVVLDQAQRSKYFLNRSISISQYENLDYAEQTDIFNRLQNGVQLSDGELIISNFTNQECSTVIGKFFDEHTTHFEKYVKVKRREHHQLIVEIMFILDKGLNGPINKLKIKSFLIELDKDKKRLEKLITTTGKLIKIIFTDKLLTNSQMLKIKMKQNVLLVLIWILNNKFQINLETLSDKKTCDKLIEIINDTNKDLNQNKKMKGSKIEAIFLLIFNTFNSSFDTFNTDDNVDDEIEDIKIDKKIPVAKPNVKPIKKKKND